MTISNSNTQAPCGLVDAQSNLVCYIQLINNELHADFEVNVVTRRLTENQKQLLPLLAQLTSAWAALEARSK